MSGEEAAALRAEVALLKDQLKEATAGITEMREEMKAFIAASAPASTPAAASPGGTQVRASTSPRGPRRVRSVKKATDSTPDGTPVSPDSTPVSQVRTVSNVTANAVVLREEPKKGILSRFTKRA